MELKASFDSIVSEQERQNRMIGNLMSDNTHLKSQWIRYDPERQEIRQCDAINELSGPLAIFIWRIAVAHGVGHSRIPPSDFFHGRAGSPCHFLALITPKTFGSLELITPMR